MASQKKASSRLTPEMAIDIWICHLLGNEFQHQIAAYFGINQGRVSEVLNGTRFPGSRAVALKAIGT